LKQFGFAISPIHPIHWFQFADDAATITSLGQEIKFSSITSRDGALGLVWLSELINAQPLDLKNLKLHLLSISLNF